MTSLYSVSIMQHSGITVQIDISSYILLLLFGIKIQIGLPE